MDSRWKPTSKIGEVSVKWDTIQSDRFIVWANHHLQKRNMQIKDLSEFADGVLLLNLLEEASGKKIAKYIKSPRFLQHKIENVTIALNFVEKMLDVRMVGCNAKDIADGNIKQIMAMMFMLTQKAKPGTLDKEGLESLEKDTTDTPKLSTATTDVSSVKPTPAPGAVVEKAPPKEAPKKEPPKKEVIIIKSKDIMRERSRSSPSSPGKSIVAAKPAANNKEKPKEAVGITNKPKAAPPQTRKEIATEVKVVSKIEGAPAEQQSSHAHGEKVEEIAQVQTTEVIKEVENQKVEKPEEEHLQERPEEVQKEARKVDESPANEIQETAEAHKADAVDEPKDKIEHGQKQDESTLPAQKQEQEQKEVQKEEQKLEKELEQSEHGQKQEQDQPAQEQQKQVEEMQEDQQKQAQEQQKQEQEQQKQELEQKQEQEQQKQEEQERQKQEGQERQKREEQQKQEQEQEQQKQEQEQERQKHEEQQKQSHQAQKEKIKQRLEIQLQQKLLHPKVFMSPVEDDSDMDEGEVIKIEIDLDTIISLQSSIRQYLGYKLYIAGKDAIDRRKKDLELLFTSNARVLHILVKIQACVRGRIERRKLRRNTAIYRRNEIAKEIVSTEKRFVANLDVLVEKFLEPLKKMLQPPQIRNLFSNVDVIRNYNRQLCTRLEDRMANWYTAGQRLGDIFYEMTEFLKVYTTFVNNYNTSIATMTSLIAENSKFAHFLEKMKGAPECNGLEFAAFLIQPIQRLPRYVMLLQDLTKHTPPGHLDYEKLNQALKKMKDVADYVNERKREAENLTQVLAIQAKLIGKFDNLAEPHRRYVRKGSLAMLDEKGNMKTLFFFLFNDILIYTENKSASRIFRGSFGKSAPNWDEAAFNTGRFKFIGQIALAGMHAGLADVPDSEKDKILCAFQLITPTTSILLMAMNPDEKLAWMNDLDECINQLLEKERSRKFSHCETDIEDVTHEKTRMVEIEGSDYSGVLHKKGNNDEWKQRWFFLRGGRLHYADEKPPADIKEVKAKSIHLMWCSVKGGHAVGRPCVLQLATPARIYFFSAADYRSMFQWIYVLRLSIVQQVASFGEPVAEAEPDTHVSTEDPSKDTTIEVLLRSSPNRVCADCSAPDPSWVSISLGVFVCLECSGIHRRLPPGVSVLKSLRSLGASPESVDIKSLGNAQANAKYEKNVPAFMQKPTPSDPYDIKVNWIRAKYLDEKQLAAITPTNRRLSSTVSSTTPSTPPPLASTHNASSPTNSPSSSYQNLLATAAAAAISSTTPLSPTRSSSPPHDLSIRRKASGVFEKVSKNKEGNLYKRQGALLQDEWKMYRFVLRDGQLVYFKPKRQKESGAIDLLLCGVKLGDCITQNNERPKYVFEIIAPTRIYMLAAESKEARDEWVQSINVCIVTALSPS